MAASSSLFKMRMLAGSTALLFAAELASDLFNYPPLMIGIAIAGIVTSLLVLLLCLRIRRTLTDAAEVIAEVAAGDFEKRLIGIQETGAIGKLLHGVNELVDRTDAFVREAGASMEAVSRGVYYRRIIERGMGGDFLRGARVINAATLGFETKIRNFATVTDHFEQTIGSVVKMTAAAATELEATAEGMKSTAGSNSESAVLVASASHEASTNVQTVAAAAEELAQAIAEVSRQVVESSNVAARAVEQARRTDALVAGLGESSQRIGEVVNLINDIASQTNLLALNATIEAARAGDAGKGFAVVAGEVKNLASQTAKATEEITQLVSAVQSASRESGRAISEITETITSVERFSSAIASAVEQQTAATREIAQNVDQASTGTEAVNRNVSTLADGARLTGDAANDMLSASHELSRQSELLSSSVSGFLDELKQVV